LTERGSYLSLRTRTAALLLFSVVCSLLLFTILQVAGEQLLAESCQSPEAQLRREERIIERFSEYVMEHDIALSDAEKLAEWGRMNPGADIQLYREERLVYDTGSFDYFTGTDYTVSQSSLVLTDDMRSYVVPMADGSARAVVFDYSSEDDYIWLKYLLFAVCCGIFIAVMLYFDWRKTRRIVELCERVKDITAGGLSERISVDGNDELSELGANIDEMRITIIERIESEQEAMKANSELVTAMSHDLRTPLTALLGYLDIMARGGMRTEEQKSKYLGVCLEKAYQIKEMSDEMFQYFLAFDITRKGVKTEPVSAETLVQQMVLEHIIYLRDHGFDITINDLGEDVIVAIENDGMRRVFDNVFFNMEKYADSSRPATVTVSASGDSFIIEAANYCRPDIERIEGTHIGIKTCQRIMGAIGGRFTAAREDDRFIVSVQIPLAKDENEEWE